MKLAFIDLETVRLAPGPETIWELAVVFRDERLTPSDSEYCWQIRPDLSNAEAGALKIGGYYSRCQVRSQPVGTARAIHAPNSDATTAHDVASAVASLLDGVLLVGANVGSFDVPHLDRFLRAHGECLEADYHYLDIGSLAIGWAHGSGLVPAKPLKLDQALRLCGLDPDGYEAHTALGDARAVRDIWDVVTGGPS